MARRTRAVTHDLDLVDVRRVHGEDALDSDAVGDLADREALAHAATLAADHDALEHLDALFFAFTDLDVDPHRVTRAEVRDVVAQLLLFELA